MTACATKKESYMKYPDENYDKRSNDIELSALITHRVLVSENTWHSFMLCLEAQTRDLPFLRKLLSDPSAFDDPQH